MKTTMYKFKDHTSEEVFEIEVKDGEYASRDIGFFPDENLTRRLETLNKQQADSGLGFDMDKVKEIVGWACDFGSDSPDGVRKAILDADQLWESFGPGRSSGKSCIDVMMAGRPDVHLAGEDPALIWFDETLQDGDEMFIKWMKRRERPELQPLPKGAVHDEVQLERKHPYIFKITDLAEDPAEFIRLEMRLESDQQFSKHYGFKMTPIFVEAIPDANIISRTVNDTMKKLVKLSVEYKVEIYFGTKSALKPLMYQFMYGARRADMDLSGIEEISVEKAKEMVDNQCKVAIVGGGSIGASLAAALSGYSRGELCAIGHSFDTWDLNEFAAIAKVEKPARDWEQGKLRRGKGHNKFKRKGKK